MTKKTSLTSFPFFLSGPNDEPLWVDHDIPSLLTLLGIDPRLSLLKLPTIPPKKCKQKNQVL